MVLGLETINRQKLAMPGIKLQIPPQAGQSLPLPDFPVRFPPSSEPKIPALSNYGPKTSYRIPAVLTPRHHRTVNISTQLGALSYTGSILLLVGLFVIGCPSGFGFLFYFWGTRWCQCLSGGQYGTWGQRSGRWELGCVLHSWGAVPSDWFKEILPQNDINGA